MESREVDANEYRDRIYGRYVHSRSVPLVQPGEGGFESRRPYLVAMIRRHFPSDRGAAILDLGCGHGTAIYFAKHAGYTNIRGVDRSPEQVAEAWRLGVTGVSQGDLVETVRASATQSLDLVLTFDVIEHFRRDELLALVDQIHRILQPSGRWIAHTVNAESPFFGRIRYGDVTHEQAFTRTSIGQLLLSSGFKSVACYEDAPVVHGLKSAARYAVWKMARGIMRIYLAAETGSTDRSVILSQNFLFVANK